LTSHLLASLGSDAIDLLDDLTRLARVKQHRPRLAGRRHPRAAARAHARQWQITALGSPPFATAAGSSSIRLRSKITPRSLSPRCSLVRSAMAPWPTHATKSWFMM